MSHASAPAALTLELFDGSDQLTSFRPIHYLGSKLRIVPLILQTLDEADPQRGGLCDLFAGSGTVALAASRQRRVIAVDIQEYSRVICSAVLRGGPASFNELELRTAVSAADRNMSLRQIVEPLVEWERRALWNAAHGRLEPICDLLEGGNVVAIERGLRRPQTELQRLISTVVARLTEEELIHKTVCLRHFGGIFFSYSQALELDMIADFIRPSSSGADLSLAALLSTASEAVNTVGKQFAQPIRPRSKTGEPKKHLVSKIIQDRRRSVLDIYASFIRSYGCLRSTMGGHEAHRGDFREALKSLKDEVSVVYADPPYTRDHYSRFYHVLETIALGDDPELAFSNLGGGSVVSRGMYRAERHQSEFCIKSTAPCAFEDLFRGVATLNVPLVLSYSAFDSNKEARPRLLGIRDVVDIARCHFNKIEVREVDELSHNKLNHSALNKEGGGTKEVLITCSSAR